MGKLFVNFALASDGKVASMKIDGLTEFMRRPAPPDTSKRASR
jgi:hypothetical protein